MEIRYTSQAMDRIESVLEHIRSTGVSPHDIEDRDLRDLVLDIDKITADNNRPERYTMCAAAFTVAAFRLSKQAARAGKTREADVYRMAGTILTGSDIHYDADIGPGFHPVHGNVVIGGTAKIGSNFMVFQFVSVANKYPFTKLCAKEGRVHAEIGNGVTMYASSCTMGPVKIGNYAKIFTNTVVCRDVADRERVKCNSK